MDPLARHDIHPLYASDLSAHAGPLRRRVTPCSASAYSDSSLVSHCTRLAHAFGNDPVIPTTRSVLDGVPFPNPTARDSASHLPRWRCTRALLAIPKPCAMPFTISALATLPDFRKI